MHRWGHWLLALLVVLPCLQAQEGASKINFRYTSYPLIRAIDELINDYDVLIAYQSHLIRKERVTASCSECSPSQALDALLVTTDLMWVERGGQYILRKKVESGGISGRVILKEEEIPLTDVEVMLIELGKKGESLPRRTLTSPSGKFTFKDLDPGTYNMEVRAFGFADHVVENVVVAKNEMVGMDIAIEEVAIPLESIVVTPSYYSMNRDENFAIQILDREQIRRIPRLGDDTYRMLEHLPGISSADLNSAFRIRGGEVGETLILFDGVEVVEPYHLKSVFSGLFSIIDAEYLGEVELLTGGVPIQYGNRMSGVFNISSLRPDHRETTVSFTTLSLKFKTQGLFHGGRGTYLLSSRQGFFNQDDILTEFTETLTNVNPATDVNYGDTYGKVEYRLGNHLLSANTLLADDDASLDERPVVVVEGEVGRIETKSDNTVLWLNLQSFWSDNLYSGTVVSSTGFSRDTNAIDTLGLRHYQVDDVRDYSSWTLRQDWTYSFKERHFMKWGLEAKSAEYTQVYHNQREDFGTLINTNTGSTDVAVDTENDQLGFYLADRMRLNPQLTIEAGLRYDSQSLTDETQVSPRFYTTLDQLDVDGSFKFGWGRFYQPQALFEVQAEDDIDQYFPAELAEHWILAYERRFVNGVTLRGEAYTKKYSQMRPKYINFLDPLNSFPEIQGDRVRLEPESAQAQGLELTLSQRIGSNSSWIANYTISDVADKVAGVDVHRQWDQRHAVNLAFNYGESDRWNINVAWHYHTGWRTTDIQAVKIDGPPGEAPTVVADIQPFYEAFFPAYHRMDMRYNRRFFNRGRHALSLFVEVTNLYDQRNIQSYGNHRGFLGNDNTAELSFDSDVWIPQISTFGFHWTF